MIFLNKDMKIAVIGAGNGGQAIAGYLGLAMKLACTILTNPRLRNFREKEEYVLKDA